MASFTPSTFDISSINGGQRFEEGDGITAEATNAPIEAALYAQSLATNAPDVSEANRGGTPSVSIVSDGKGGVKLKFENLKSNALYVATSLDELADYYYDGDIAFISRQNAFYEYINEDWQLVASIGGGSSTPYKFVVDDNNAGTFYFSITGSNIGLEDNGFTSFIDFMNALRLLCGSVNEVPYVAPCYCELPDGTSSMGVLKIYDNICELVAVGSGGSQEYFTIDDSTFSSCDVRW